jgi:hypothetical protein
MTHSHIRIHEPLPPLKPQYAVWAILGCILIAVSALYFWSNLRADAFWEIHSSAEGTVSETRIVVDHVRDSGYGGVVYRLEAHVSFKAEGRDQDRWLTVSTDTADRGMLMAKLATNPKTCRVYWVPGHPDNAKCKLR